MKRIIIIAGASNFACYKALPLVNGSVELLSIDCSLDAIWKRCPDILLIDFGYDDYTGLALLGEVKTRRPDLPVIFLTDAGSEATAVAAFRMGARDYFKKPVDLFLLSNRVESIVQVRKETTEWRLPLSAESCENILVGGSSVNTVTAAGIQRAVCFIEKNLSASVTVEDLADKAGMSKYHFCRVFKKTTGISPKAFVNARRVARAKELLCSEDLRISTVALRSGFNDFSNFIRSFKIVTGVTPSAYRECLKQMDMSVTPATIA